MGLPRTSALVAAQKKNGQKKRKDAVTTEVRSQTQNVSSNRSMLKQGR